MRKINYILELFQNCKNWYLILLDRFFGIVPRKVYLRNGLIITGGNNSLITDLIYEVFIRKVYNPKFLRIKYGDTVIDMGANIGIFSLYAAKNGAQKIYSIEPLSSNIPFIRKNFKINRLRAPVIVEKAISDRKGNAKLYLGDSDSHGLLFSHDRMRKFSEYQVVKITTLPILLLENKITKIDFLKIDCEGSEGQIIASTPKNVWIHIDKIAIEYHNNVSSLDNNEIVEKLKTFGYKTKTKPSDELFGYIYAWR